MARFSVLFCLLLLGSSFLFAQQTPPTTSPSGATLAAQSIAAMTGGTAVSDVTLTGTVTWFAGSDTETGTATFLAKGTSEAGWTLS